MNPADAQQTASDLWSFLGVLVTVVGSTGVAWIVSKRTGRPPGPPNRPADPEVAEHEPSSVVFPAPAGQPDHVIDTSDLPEQLARVLNNLAPAIASQTDQINTLSGKIAELRNELDLEKLHRQEDNRRHEIELLELQAQHRRAIEQLKKGVESGDYPPWPPDDVH